MIKIDISTKVDDKNCTTLGMHYNHYVSPSVGNSRIHTYWLLRISQNSHFPSLIQAHPSKNFFKFIVLKVNEGINLICILREQINPKGAFFRKFEGDFLNIFCFVGCFF